MHLQSWHLLRSTYILYISPLSATPSCTLSGAMRMKVLAQNPDVRRSVSEIYAKIHVPLSLRSQLDTNTQMRTWVWAPSSSWRDLPLTPLSVTRAQHEMQLSPPQNITHTGLEGQAINTVTDAQTIIDGFHCTFITPCVYLWPAPHPSSVNSECLSSGAC